MRTIIQIAAIRKRDTAPRFNGLRFRQLLGFLGGLAGLFFPQTASPQFVGGVTLGVTTRQDLLQQRGTPEIEPREAVIDGVNVQAEPSLPHVLYSKWYYYYDVSGVITSARYLPDFNEPISTLTEKYGDPSRIKPDTPSSMIFQWGDSVLALVISGSPVFVHYRNTTVLTVAARLDTQESGRGRARAEWKIWCGGTAKALPRVGSLSYRREFPTHRDSLENQALNATYRKTLEGLSSEFRSSGRRACRDIE